jgi:hypothetical protein
VRAAPEDSRRREGFGGEAHDADHEKPQSKVPHFSVIGLGAPHLEGLFVPTSLQCLAL